MLQNDFYFNSLASAHYKNYSVFCTDVCNAMPGIMIEMLVNSKNDVIELLPALPESLTQGSISGVKTRNQVTIESLEWNGNKITCKLKSNVNQKITLIQRKGMSVVSGKNVKIEESPMGREGRVLYMIAGKTAEIEIIE